MNAAEPLVRALVDDLVADDPVLATGLGLPDGMDRLPSWSPDAARRRLAMLHEHERRLTPLLAAADRETAIDAFTGLQVVRRLLREFETFEAPSLKPTLYLDVVAGLFPLLVREVGSLEERVEALRGRLGAVPGLLEEARANLRPGLQTAALEAAIDYADGLTELVGPTALGFARDAGREGRLDDVSAAAVAAVEDFGRHLRGMRDGADERCGIGRDAMVEILRWEHALPDEPEDLASYGREVLAATRAEMRSLAADMGHADVRAAVAAARADHVDPAALVDEYAAAVAAAREYIVSHGIVTLPPGEELEVIATPPFLRSMLPFAAYEPPGPFHARQLGLYYVTPPAEDLTGDELEEALRNHPRASLPTTGVHEAYPGHHLQLCTGNRAATLVRRIAAIPSGAALLVEGWAFYCEEMMERQGFLADPAVRLMRLNDQVWRACRVIIDVELHLGVLGLDDAVRMLVDTAHMSPHEALLECRRYALEPGQALSYLIGRREVLKLADSYRERRSASLREFHDELLRWGCLSPAVIAWGMGLAGPPAAARPAS